MSQNSPKHPWSKRSLFGKSATWSFNPFLFAPHFNCVLINDVQLSFYVMINDKLRSLGNKNNKTDGKESFHAMIYSYPYVKYEQTIGVGWRWYPIGRLILDYWAPSFFHRVGTNRDGWRFSHGGPRNDEDSLTGCFSIFFCWCSLFNGVGGACYLLLTWCMLRETCLLDLSSVRG